MRPALWGFFVCIGLALLVLGIRFFIPTYITQRWNEEDAFRRSRHEQVIREVFQDRVDQLQAIVDRVSRDSVLLSSIDKNDVSATLQIFQTLNHSGVQGNRTLDLIDSSGTMIAWHGSSITGQYSEFLGTEHPERILKVVQNGLRTYLTVGKRIASTQYYIIASELLELNSPISNRFIQKVSLSEELSRKLNTTVSLRTTPVVERSQQVHSISILDENKKPIVEFSVEEKSIESTIASLTEQFSMVSAICIAIAIALLLYAGIQWSVQRYSVGLSTTTIIFVIWIVRIIWRALEFPAAIIGGQLFAPNLYGSSFFFGLSSSLGELFLSVVALTISAWIIFQNVVLKNAHHAKIPKILNRLGKAGSVLLTIIIGILILWSCRGVSEAIRSFVFDSTVQYNNPSELLLNSAAASMFFNVLLLGVSLLCISVSLIWIARAVLLSRFSLSNWGIRIFLVFLLCMDVPFFVFLDESSSMLIVGLVFLFTFSIFLSEFVLRWNGAQKEFHSIQWNAVVWLMVGAFFLATPLLFSWLQEREDRRIETVARDVSRPSDNWLSFVVLQGLHASIDDIKKEFTSDDLADAKQTSLAFVLWTKTLLGKEGYNSAIVLFDSKGNEVDRFVVGMNKPDQQDILTKVFQGEEDVVHILDRAGQKTLGKLYGAWMTVLDENDEFAGSLALILSENQKTLFRNQETEPLRQFGDAFEDDIEREIAIHKYVNDTLVFSTGNKLIPEKFLPSQLAQELIKEPREILWKHLNMNGYGTRTVFVNDKSSPEQIIAVSLENVDVRWKLFSYLKEFVVCMFLLIVLGAFRFIRREYRVQFSLGFKDKLFLGFIFIALLPLGILSYYNKRLVEERVQQEVNNTLYHELSRLQDRIATYVTDEEDFKLGVDDDFCEALATEYSVDFSVYSNSLIQASSQSELYRAGLMDTRLNGEAYSSIVLEGRNNFLTKENIGSVGYVVGYAPITIGGALTGILAIPTLNREKEFEAELAQRNAYVFGAYAIVFGIALMAGGVLAFRFSRPLQELTIAAKDVSEGDLDVRVKAHTRDELGILSQSFNEMVSKLRASRKELAAHERETAWKEMAKQVAHEIRNPLTPIKLSIQHLRQAFKDQAPDREEILKRVTQTVIDQIETLSRIASEFSSFAKMPESKFEKIDLHALLKETMILFREIRGITFVDRCMPSSVFVVADRDQLRGVFINIIRNAIQAIKEHGTITVGTSLEGHICLVQLSDTGPGIPEDIRTRIFEPNFSTKTEGMGLGLAIARRVIEDHGGTIECISKLGKGTTFEIRLPI